MMTSDELTLGALKREHTRLSRIATKAKAEVDEYMGAGTEIFTVYAELAKIIESRAHGPQVIKRLGDLKKQQDKAERVNKKDLLKLLDRQFETGWDRDQMAREISTVEFRLSLRHPH